jgi:hypothetical protein
VLILKHANGIDIAKPSYFVLRLRSCSRRSLGDIDTLIGAKRTRYCLELAILELFQ